MHVIYNKNKSVGSRVQSVMIRCSDCNLPAYEPIQLDKQYKIIMSKYLINGGDGYTMIKEGTINNVILSKFNLMLICFLESKIWILLMSNI